VQRLKKYATDIERNGTKNMPLILGGMAQKICHYYWVEWHKKYATDIGWNGTKNMPLTLGGMAQKICH